MIRFLGEGRAILVPSVKNKFKQRPTWTVTWRETTTRRENYKYNACRHGGTRLPLYCILVATSEVTMSRAPYKIFKEKTEEIIMFKCEECNIKVETKHDLENHIVKTHR